MNHSFDFDQLADLYKSDPERFQKIARQMIEDYIASIPDEISRKKCAGLQFKLDHELSKYHDPIARMNKMIEIFWQGVYQFHGALTGTMEHGPAALSNKVVVFTDFKAATKSKKQLN